MSMCDWYSCWRCPNCQKENVYSLSWQHYYKFKEFPDDVYSKEVCKNCMKEYYVNPTEPNPYCFKMTRGECKNDYIKDMVLDVNEKLTIVDEFWTD